MAFEFHRTAIHDVILIKVIGMRDARGFFRETYKRSVFVANGILENFVQDNHSRSARGVLRGLHYQKLPQAQGKLVACVKGEVFDVAVDIRKGSPTYGKWVGETLSEENGVMLYIPPGFAHGFCVRSEFAELMYKTTAEYAPELDRGIRWDDAAIGVNWNVSDPILSAKDANAPLLKDADNNFVYAA